MSVAHTAKRNFRLISIIGFTAVLMCTWEAILLYVGRRYRNLSDDGQYCKLYPTKWRPGRNDLDVSGVALRLRNSNPEHGRDGFDGTYFWWSMSVLHPLEHTKLTWPDHWVSEFSPKSCQQFLSYITGWLCVLGWQVNIASGSYLVALQLQGIILLNDDSYTPQPWHATLMVIAVAVVAILFNTFFASRLPLIEGMMLVIHILGFFAILIPLWVLAPRQDPTTVFTEFTNAYGWPTQGVACLVGIIGPMYSLLGPDSAVHMAEEVQDASRVLPVGMMWTLIINGITGFIMVITFAFAIPDIDSALAPTYNFTYIDTFYYATQSKAGASIMTALITLMCLCSTISNVATASRQMYAFARDRGLPFSKTLSHVHPGWNLPLNAIAVSFVITCLLSLINLGSSVAFNAIVSLTVGAILSSYIISISCVALRKIRKDHALPATKWSLGPYGLPLNIMAVAFLLIVYVFTFFPLATPVEPDTMNWSSLIYGVVVIFAILWFCVYGRRVYAGPVTLVKQYQ